MSNTTRKCSIIGKEFFVADWEKEIVEKMGFPLPTICPDERLKRRLSYRNERFLYSDKCDLTGKPMISIYSPDLPYKVYSPAAWWGDDWDPKKYGRDYDFNRPFFDQYYELQLKVPRLSLMNTHAENSEYCNYTTSNKNCYLIFGGDFNEDCYYSSFCFHSKNCSDVYWIDNSELCYEIFDCDRCYNLKYSQNCNNCRDGAFLFECNGCSNCFGCVGLRNKQYHIYNERYSPEEYSLKIKKFVLDSWSEVEKLKDEFAQYKLKFPHRFAQIFNCENASGDHITSAKNCINCFDIFGPAEDVKDVFLGGWNMKSILSCDHLGHDIELFYECLSAMYGYNCAFNGFVWNSSDIFYSHLVFQNSKHCFGCSCVKKAEYCILNKQYSKEEYFKMKDRIVEHMIDTGEWGQYFPMKYSPFAYNETIAQDLYPMTKEDVLSQGLKWLDEEQKEIGSEPEIPDSINDVDNSILEKTLVCEKTGRFYKINKNELELYRRLGIPVPKYAPETRHRLRLSMRNPNKIWERKCGKCGAEILTSYSPDRPEKVYCEKCYLEEVY